MLLLLCLPWPQPSCLLLMGLLGLLGPELLGLSEARMREANYWDWLSPGNEEVARDISVIFEKGDELVEVVDYEFQREGSN